MLSEKSTFDDEIRFPVGLRRARDVSASGQFGGGRV
jgi:hypothetical protein